jgi:hypothetical protein
MANPVHGLHSRGFSDVCLSWQRMQQMHFKTVSLSSPYRLGEKVAGRTPSNSYPKPRLCLGNSGSCMNDLAQFQPAFNGVNTVSTNMKQSRSQMGTLNWKETVPFKIVETYWADMSVHWIDCHQPPFGWITNDCLVTSFGVLHRRWRHEAKYGIPEYSLIILSHIVLAKFSTSREMFWSLLTFHAN